jgi:Predicted dioxygenase
MSIRQADKAGTWYSRDPDVLRQEIAECMDRADRLLATAAPACGSPVAAVVPHAGLFYSGGIAATSFRKIGETFQTVDTFVIFGACHRERLRKPALWTKGSWQTPIGGLPIDEELAQAFLDAGIGEENERAHTEDNAIELLTPFVKALYPNAKILPVAMDFYPDSWRYGSKAAEVMSANPVFSGKTMIALASTDLTHYGASFGVMPAGTGQKALDWARENDQRFLTNLTDMSLDNIVSTAIRDHSACGAGAAAAAAGWAKKCGCDKGILLAYETSYDIMPQGIPEHFVGYGSVLYCR